MLYNEVIIRYTKNQRFFLYLRNMNRRIIFEECGQKAWMKFIAPEGYGIEENFV